MDEELVLHWENAACLWERGGGGGETMRKIGSWGKGDVRM